MSAQGVAVFQRTDCIVDHVEAFESFAFVRARNPETHDAHVFEISREHASDWVALVGKAVVVTRTITYDPKPEPT